MKNKIRILLFVFVTFFCTIVFVNQPASTHSSSIQISFIDVGQGDSALVQTSDGYNILIDGGIASAGSTILEYLRNNGVYNLNAVIASHQDSDHIGGLIGVLNASDISVDSVIYNGYPGQTQTWNDFILAVANKGLSLTTAQFPEELHWGVTTVYVLNPQSGLINPETNDASLVLLFDHYDIETLFTGDIDSTLEAQIITRETPIAADILKVAHHGSNYSTGMEFLNAIQPDDSVISVGTNNYGHPGEDTLARLYSIGTHIWRTDYNGSILITSTDGITYQVIPSKSGKPIFLPLLGKNVIQDSTPTPN